MASVGELKDEARVILQALIRARGMISTADEIVEEESGHALRVLGESEIDLAQVIMFRCRSAETAIDDVLTNLGLAIESLETYIGTR